VLLEARNDRIASPGDLACMAEILARALNGYAA
jgi:predicted N-formylglutamate amidohydrolase